MNGRTHEAVGIASVMVAMHSSPTADMLIGCLIASAAAVMPDVDLIDNRKGEGIQMLVEVVKQSVIPIGFALYYGADKALIIGWIILMSVLVLQPHRGLSHSIWCMIVTAGIFGCMTTEKLIYPFLVAYGSHLAIDLMNTKKVSLLYPAGTCLGWCKSGGKADWMLGAMASLVIITIIASRTYQTDLVSLGIEEVVKILGK